MNKTNRNKQTNKQTRNEGELKAEHVFTMFPQKLIMVISVTEKMHNAQSSKTLNFLQNEII